MRSDLPTGTVTFVFTDVEGSTRLLTDLGATAYAAALQEHRRVLRAAFVTHGGVEVDTQGDALFFAFPTAPAAIEGAVEAQRALEAGSIRVRMGVHTGTPHLTDDGYVGIDVHRAARIASAGHGGQVLVSAPTASLLAADSDLQLLDLGVHRLKDLSAPERISQVGTHTFPALKTLYRTNLPVPVTPFLGRDTELAEVLALLEHVRLLTLTGPGGTGKTRLGLQAVARAADRYPEGVFWVPLASLRDAGLVQDAAARAVGARGDLAAHISDKSLVMLFDNFEHVLDAAAVLGELLVSCPSLQLVVTSREVLRLPGEQTYPVPPLDPVDGEELFLARAREARPDFVATAAVPELCARLDNLPLALELAAARVRLLSPGQLLERLSQRLDLLTAGRGVDPRQQTLRATIEWSYDLLEETEQRLFARFAVFDGSWTLEAAETICEADLDTLQSLIEKSLVRVRQDDRFWMLETIREYAMELLAVSPGREELLNRRAEYFLSLAETAEPELRGSRQDEWLSQLEADLPNLRAVLEWATVRGAGDDGLRLATALGDLWFKHGHLPEGRRWLTEFVDAPSAGGKARAKGLVALSVLATMRGDWPEAERRSEEALRLCHELGEPGIGSWAKLARGRTLMATGDLAGARLLFEQAESLGESEGDVETVAVARFNFGYASLGDGDYAQARRWFEAALKEFLVLSEGYWVARSLAALGSVSLHQDHAEEAIELLRRSVGVSSRSGDLDNLAWAVELLGVTYARVRDPAAARLLGAAEELRDQLGASLEGVELALHEQASAELDQTLDPDALAAAWAAGRALSPDEIVEEALGLEMPPA
jgi:predicted ATPase/class 3 adenylate cyclase